MARRVVITGYGLLCALGVGEDAVAAFLDGKDWLREQADWQEVAGLPSIIAARMDTWRKPPDYPRKKTRTMGRVALFAAHATDLALNQANLVSDDQRETLGVAFGSSLGSPPSIEHYARQVSYKQTLAGVTASDYIKFMSHTAAANLVQFFGFKSRLIPTCEMCTSGSRAIGTAFQSIRFGQVDAMAAGGSEELGPLQSAFLGLTGMAAKVDSLIRPFANQPTGTFPGEGAASLILEAADHAEARGAQPLAEVLGFGSTSTPANVANCEAMETAIRQAVENASLQPDDIQAVIAHGIATSADHNERAALAAVFGKRVPVTAFKSQLGHTFGASGAIDTVLGMALFRRGIIVPIKNLGDQAGLDDVDLVSQQRAFRGDTILIHTHGFGGISIALVLRLLS